MATYIGRPLKRFEDPRLVRGQGSFVEDMQLPDMLHAVVLRSPHAHARILALDVSVARALPGVITVLTAEDLADAVGDIPPRPTPELVGVRVPEHPVLARHTVCYVGQPVAIVVAQERYLANDALELIRVTYQPLPVVVDPVAAAQEGAVLLHDEFGTNVALHLREGRGDVAASFARADHIVRGRYEVPRLSPVPMECRGLIAQYQPETQHLTLWASTQVPHRLKGYLGRVLRQMPRELRVIAPDVGGGFGQKVELWPEDVALSYLAMQLARPVKWIETRRENLLAYHGRGYSADVEAAVQRDGTILAMRFRIFADVGAYYLTSTAGPPINAMHRVAGPYAIPDMEVECLSVLTNKPPTGPYRGAGGPEGAFFMERTIDLIARELHLDPAAVRRRNFVPPEAFPYTTATGLLYDSGNFLPAFERALELGDYTGFRQQQATRGSSAPLLGIGIATVVKASGGRGEMKNGHALVRVEPTGQVTIHTEASPHGQGTATTFAQITADTLGVRPEDVQVRHGDTLLLPAGQGTFASRGLTVGGSAMYAGLQQARQHIARLAARLLECEPGAIGFQEGLVFNTHHPERTLALSDVVTEGLEFPSTFSLEDNPFGFAAHVAVVEVDPDTGTVKLLRYAAVHDSGRIINPKLLEGQIYGAIAQGLGQALCEGMHYSPDGQPLTGSLLDYAIPRADDMPMLHMATFETLSPTNPLGLKGVGELPTVAAPVALVNAVVDALASAGVRHLDAPLTAEKIWRALHGRDAWQ